MPGNLDADALERQVLETVRGLSQDVATVREHVREDMAEAIGQYRKDINVTLMAIQSHQFDIEKRLEQIDLARIDGQRYAHTFRLLTLGAIVVLIVINLMVLSYLFGRQAASTLAVWVY